MFLEIAMDCKEFMIPQTVPNNPINGAVDPTVARKVKFFSSFLICSSVAISKILPTLAAWTEDDCLFVLINSFIAVLKIIVAGSFELAGRLLLKFSADFAFQNFFSKSAVEALMLLNNLNLSKINAHEKIELAIKRIITNLTTKSARKKSFNKEKAELPPTPTTWAANSCSIEVNYF